MMQWVHLGADPVPIAADKCTLFPKAEEMLLANMLWMGEG
jgi:hypothetical protein